MKKLLNRIMDMLADAGLLEMGINAATPVAKAETVRETLEENLVEIAFAEESDYDDIHKAILREYQLERDISNPEDSQYGNNDICFV